MTRRQDALIPLTCDHHHALAQARRLSDVSKLDDVTERPNGADDFLNSYFGRAVRHFHEEEELFCAPLIDHEQARDLIVHAGVDELRLHALVRTVKRQLAAEEVDRDTLSEISTILTEHVRFEEKELFPLIQRLVPEDHLRDLATARRRDV